MVHRELRRFKSKKQHTGGIDIKMIETEHKGNTMRTQVHSSTWREVLQTSSGEILIVEKGTLVIHEKMIQSFL